MCHVCLRPFVSPRGQRAIVGEMNFEIMVLLHHNRLLLVTDNVHIRDFCAMLTPTA